MRSRKKRERTAGRRIRRIAAVVILAPLLILGAVLGWLTLAEYRPADVEALEIRYGGENADAAAQTAAGAPVSSGDALKIMTWNIGYGCLGDNADFFMDGGTHVKTADRHRLAENMEAILEELRQEAPDAVLLQEVDAGSARSYNLDETALLHAAFPEQAGSVAPNMRVPFIPYPIPPIGKVDAGVMTLSRLRVTDAARLQLPVPFTWPVRIANLKRCLMASRIPVVDENNAETGKELVLVNLHLEAYDSGEGKAAQTAMLRDFLNEEAAKGNYVIAGGDFNQRFSSVDPSLYPELEGMWHCGELDVSEFGDEWDFVTDAGTPTCRSLDKSYVNADGTAPSHDPSAFQFYVIDGFIISRNVELADVRTKDLGFAHSDHNPVVMQVTLR
ncbi:endonuclease/exonuclease/phosphatase family protein [Lachnoclostridium sp. Marseille-P6806]|uniref:endonuclease/exonuclease/phosphatase family protein n=1 Tax=Lachnoclostridium sp. Marseille-P6806 TaxID=2364793 RepID=UPI001F5EB6FA|nr:endonuclease/exonuclease/phosphatase family protein [Lachnoclostridium sp. Marseille-P6806]